MIIDSHAHLVAPTAFNSVWTVMEAAGSAHGRMRPMVTDEELIASADKLLAMMDEVGTDMQLVSPRPFTLKHSHRPHQIVQWWVSDNNDAIATQVAARPERLRGVAGLPQLAGEPVSVAFDELDRAINELGFVGVLLNPDPGEGDGRTPPMGDEYWYPMYEKLVDMDVPALLHSTGCYGRETYSEHFISEESLAITSMINAGIFDRFPSLKLIVPHGGGSVPYQAGRWASAYGRKNKLGPAECLSAYREQLRKFYYDTCLYTQESLELLVKVVGADRVLFGTERPGSGAPLDDLKPVIEKLDILDDAGRAQIFEENVKTVYTRLNV